MLYYTWQGGEEKCQATLIGIALLFGIGNAFDTVVSAGAYAFLLKKKKINLLQVD